MTSEQIDEPQLAADRAFKPLEDFVGPADAFWPLFLQVLVNTSGAQRALLLSSGIGLPWQALAQWPRASTQTAEDARRSLRLLSRLSTQAMLHDEDYSDFAFRLMEMGGLGSRMVAVLLMDLPEDRDMPLVQSLARRASAHALRFTAPSAALGEPAQVRNQAQPHSANHALQDGRVHEGSGSGIADGAVAAASGPAQAISKAERLHEILRLAHALSRQSRFTPAAMDLCNQLCARMGADRVSLAWRHGLGMRLVAISHVEHFDAKSNITRALEEVMEEAQEQESILVYPETEGSQAVLRAHAAYARLAAAEGPTPQMCTVPLDGAGGVVGVLSLERMGRGFDADELWELQQTGQAVCAWLTHLQAQDRWFGLRWWDAMRRSAAQLLGPRHTAAKAAALGAALFLLVGAIWPWNYRVDAILAVRSRDLLFMPAPFDGYLREVHVNVGDEVAGGTTLVELDTRDLLLEASMADADLVRYTREAEKAMAARQLAEMQIALARQQQALAKLELTRFQLANAQVKAPYDGVVIEGELKKNLGAPVRKGDLLLKLARTTRTYLELEIDQAYVHEVRVGTRGEFALVGRPGERYPITLTQLDPAAVSKDGRTVYLARAALAGQHQPDWRPGMGGNAKLDAGDRPLIWVLTQRTVRFLREFFWL